MPLLRRAHPERRSSLRLAPSPVGGQRISSRRRARTLRPRLKPCPLPPEACSSHDEYQMNRTMAWEKSPADQGNQFSPSILAGAATSQQILPRIQAPSTSKRCPSRRSEHWAPPNPGLSPSTP